MSNMLFACSILYKMKLPMLIVFNKCDVADSAVPINWMKDFDSFIVIIFDFQQKGSYQKE